MRAQLLLVASIFSACSQPPTPLDDVAAALNFPSSPNHPAYGFDPVYGDHYKNGHMLTGNIPVHLIFYGNVTAAKQAFYWQFVQDLSLSPAIQVLTTFCDQNHRCPTGRLLPTQEILPTTLAGTTLTEPDFATIINASTNPDPGGVYLMITDPAVTAGDFCGPCGWHNSVSVGDGTSNTYKYAFLGDTQYCRNQGKKKACDFNGGPISPNGDPDADRLVNTLWHELSEAITDPDPFVGWSPEIGDLCEGVDQTFGVGYAQPDPPYLAGLATTPNANIRLGTHDYFLQPMWQHVPGGGCVRRIAVNKPSAPIHGATGDFDGDGNGDLAFRNRQQALIKLRYVAANGTISGEHDQYLAGNGQVWGFGDFNADHLSDFLSRDPINGFTTLSLVASNNWMLSNSSVPLPTIKAVGDFDGNGSADILFQDLGSSQVSAWFNFGHYDFPQSDIVIPAQPADVIKNGDTVGSGDFDGDGKADVLWHYLDDNSYRYWTFHNFQITSLPVVSTGFEIPLGIVDANNDGRADLIATVGSNLVFIDVVNGAATVIAAMPTSNWRFSGGSRSATGGSVLHWQDRQSGDVKRWLLNNHTGTFASSVTAVAAPSATDELVAY